MDAAIDPATTPPAENPNKGSAIGSATAPAIPAAVPPIILPYQRFHLVYPVFRFYFRSTSVSVYRQLKSFPLCFSNTVR